MKFIVFEGLPRPKNCSGPAKVAKCGPQKLYKCVRLEVHTYAWVVKILMDLQM